MEQTDAATVAEPQEEATTSEQPLEIDDALDSIFSQSEETEEEQPTSDDEPDDPDLPAVAVATATTPVKSTGKRKTKTKTKAAPKATNPDPAGKLIPIGNLV